MSSVLWFIDGLATGLLILALVKIAATPPLPQGRDAINVERLARAHGVERYEPKRRRSGALAFVIAGLGVVVLIAILAAVAR